MASELLKALAAAKETDLQEIEAEIAKQEQVLAGLRAAQRVVRARLSGATRKKATKRAGVATEPPAASDVNTARQRIHDYLSQHGSAPAAVIGQALKMTSQQVGILCGKSDWFRRTPEGDWAVA